MEAPRAPLAGRYRFLRGLQAGAKSVCWLATDQRTGHPVIVASLGAARVAGLEGVVGVRHRHLAPILDVVHGPRQDELPSTGAPLYVTALAVAQFVSGRSMHEQLRPGPVAPAQAVAWLLRLVDAVESMHAIGGLHGAISPRSIVLEPESPDFEGPVLTQLLAAPSGPYCSPERLRGRGPGTADDVWALHATLYAALTGATPFGGTTREELVNSMVRLGPRSLSDYGLADPSLERLVLRGLSSDPVQRETTLLGLAEALRIWTRDFALTEAAHQPASERPPPLSDDEDTVTEWDDDDAKTVITTSAELFQMAEQAARSAALQAKPEEDEAPTQVVSMRHVIGPPSDRPAEPDFGPESATRVMDKHAVFQMAQAPNALPSDRPPPGAAAFPHPAFGGMPAPPPEAAAISSAPQAVRYPAGALPPGEAPKRRTFTVLVAALFTFGALAAAAYFTRNTWAGPLHRVLNGALHRGGVKAIPKAPLPSTPGLAQVEKRDAAPPDAGSRSSPGTRDGGRSEAVAAPDAASTLSECVRSLMPPRTFRKSDSFDFLCEDTDLRKVNSALYRTIVAAGAGNVTAGMRQWATLGWYELAVTAVLRGHCCPSTVSPIRLPRSSRPCTGLDRVLQKLSTEHLTKSDLHRVASPFEKDVNCLFSKGVPRPYQYREPPTPHNRRVFERFLARTLHGS